MRVRETAHYEYRICAEKRSRDGAFSAHVVSGAAAKRFFDAGVAENFPKMLVRKEFFPNFTVD